MKTTELKVKNLNANYSIIIGRDILNFTMGLASGKTPDTQEMAKGAKDYDFITSHSFVDGLINSLTFGLYNPTTVK